MKKTILRPVLVWCILTVFISCTKQPVKVYTDAEITAESKKVNDFFQKSFDDNVDN
jgi:hypothetical protein